MKRVSDRLRWWLGFALAIVVGGGVAALGAPFAQRAPVPPPRLEGPFKTEKLSALIVKVEPFADVNNPIAGGPITAKSGTEALEALRAAKAALEKNPMNLSAAQSQFNKFAHAMMMISHRAGSRHDKKILDALVDMGGSLEHINAYGELNDFTRADDPGQFNRYNAAGQVVLSDFYAIAQNTLRP